MSIPKVLMITLYHLPIKSDPGIRHRHQYFLKNCRCLHMQPSFRFTNLKLLVLITPSVKQCHGGPHFSAFLQMVAFAAFPSSSQVVCTCSQFTTFQNIAQILQRKGHNPLFIPKENFPESLPTNKHLVISLT